MTPLISIIIPVYKVEAYIADCMNSLLQQTYKNFEVIVISDGTPDNSIEIARTLTLDDERFIFIEQENHGVAFTRNLGLDFANGDYIFFVDPDDFLVENALEKLVLTAKLTDAEVVIGAYMLWMDNCFNVYRFEDYLGNNVVRDWSKTEALVKMDSLADFPLLMFSTVWGTLFSSRVLDGLRFPDGIRYAEEQFFTWKAYLASNKTVSLHQALYVYRYNPQSLTQNYDLSHLSYIDALEERFAYIQEHPELEYPIESFYAIYKFAVKSNISLLEQNGYTEEALQLKEKYIQFTLKNNLGDVYE